ncbi:MAG TPA: prepilin-type N-terminal cleavage/methylation domain-containing protein [Patescibacteria group bacterium]|nr:prepilin-type N-terminal cleavage/methylation domain-containing protein [Patescibacteria group bacterium]
MRISRQNLKVKNSKPAKNGFTLVEVLLALLVFIITTTAIIQLFPAGLRATKTSEKETTASNLLQGEIEKIQNTAYVSVTSQVKNRITSDTTSPFYDYYFQTIVIYVNNGLVQSQTETNLKKITATVFWTDGGQQKSLTSTYLKGK